MTNLCTVCGEPFDENFGFCLFCKKDEAMYSSSAKLEFSRNNKAESLLEYIDSRSRIDLCDLYDELCEITDFEQDAAELYADAHINNYIDFFIWERTSQNEIYY